MNQYRFSNKETKSPHENNESTIDDRWAKPCVRLKILL